MGSGKSYLCELIGLFAGPGGNSKVSYPTTSEEATKVILSLLLTGPAVIEFDDMDGDWTPFATIKQMLTAEEISGRILGVSKTGQVSTRALFLSRATTSGPCGTCCAASSRCTSIPAARRLRRWSINDEPVDRVRANRSRVRWRGIDHRSGRSNGRVAPHGRIQHRNVWRRLVGLLQAPADLARASRPSDGLAGTDTTRPRRRGARRPDA